jgi:hypothetical protein
LNGISPEILVNDAGQGVYGKFQDTDIHREIDIINLNIISVIILTKLFIKDRLEKGGGKILNLLLLPVSRPDLGILSITVPKHLSNPGQKESVRSLKIPESLLRHYYQVRLIRTFLTKRI